MSSERLRFVFPNGRAQQGRRLQSTELAAPRSLPPPLAIAIALRGSSRPQGAGTQPSAFPWIDVGGAPAAPVPTDFLPGESLKTTQVFLLMQFVVFFFFFNSYHSWMPSSLFFILDSYSISL